MDLPDTVPSHDRGSLVDLGMEGDVPVSLNRDWVSADLRITTGFVEPRPIVWKREAERYDPDRVGCQIESFDELPSEAKEGWQKRQFFDTRAFGKSAAGHDFPDALTEEEKRAVLEYLKTL